MTAMDSPNESYFEPLFIELLSHFTRLMEAYAAQMKEYK